MSEITFERDGMQCRLVVDREGQVDGRYHSLDDYGEEAEENANHWETELECSTRAYKAEPIADGETVVTAVGTGQLGFDGSVVQAPILLVAEGFSSDPDSH